LLSASGVPDLRLPLPTGRARSEKSSKIRTNRI